MSDSQDLPDDDKFALIISTVTDGGDFGFDSCSNCNQTIVGRPTHCPGCGAKLNGRELFHPISGQDF